MTATRFRAAAHPDGNRVVLSWSVDGAETVQLVRSRDGYPATRGAGHLVFDGDPAAGSTDDTDLAGETTYHYSLFRGPSETPIAQAAALVTSPYGHAELMYRMLPGLYRRYDALAAGDAEQGPLRHFLDLPGGQLDLLHSRVASMRDLHDVDRVDGRLLPLLANWLGWQGWGDDASQSLESRRAELRTAPDLYAATGTLPALRAAVWNAGGRSPIKDHRTQVFRTNDPPRLNLWELPGPGSGPEPSEARLLSLDHAFGGAPALVQAGDVTWLFYETERRQGPDLWSKRHDADGWSPSAPVVSSGAAHHDPSAAVLDETLWLFWAVREDGRWRIDFTRRSVDETGDLTTGWRQPTPLFTDDGVERCSPQILLEGARSLSLVWLEYSESAWELRYAPLVLSDDPGTPPTPAPPSTLSSVGLRPGVRLSAGLDKAGGLWVFWARTAAGGGREIVYVKALEGQTFHEEPLLEGSRDADQDDFEPWVVAADAEDEVEVLWIRRDVNGWSVQAAGSRMFGENNAAPTSAPEIRYGPGPWPLRHPLATPHGSLIFRSGRTVRHDAPRRPALTGDERYSGSATVDTRFGAPPIGALDDPTAHTLTRTGPYRPSGVGIRVEESELQRINETIEDFAPVGVECFREENG